MYATKLGTPKPTRKAENIIAYIPIKHPIVGILKVHNILDCNVVPSKARLFLLENNNSQTTIEKKI
tara:strand:- start:973 stop:1170 length:198 start_codon:yes stop_codon:yes gene_type:complete